MKKNVVLLFLYVLTGLPFTTFGQDTQLYGTIPAVLLSTHLNDQLVLSLQGSSEINVISRTIGGRDFPAEIMNLNLEPSLSFNLNPNINLAAAFLLRFEDPFTGGGMEYRPWQQATLIQRVRQYRIRNRLRFEERWNEDTENNTFDFRLRMRYRLSVDFPLQGERLDDQEFYLNLSSEAFFTLTADQPAYFWENRNYLGIGYRFDGNNRLEPALEFRTRRADKRGNRRNFLFFRLVWVKRLVPRTLSSS